MGCGASKVDDRPLVVLCKQRKDLIRNAADLRFFLSSSHASYFEALDSTGNALNRFLLEEFRALSASSSSPFAPSSPVLTIPSSEGKPRKSKSKSKSTSADTSTATAGGGGTSSSPSSLTHSLSLEDSNHHIASESDPEERRRKEASPQSSPVYHIPTYYYSIWQSSTNPTTVYENPYPGFGNWAGNGVQDPVSSYYAGDPSSSYYNGVPAPPATPPKPPPTPPPPESSAWDFLNPFDLSLQDYSFRKYGSLTSSPTCSLVREREGIPDLEEETESEPMREFRRDKRTRARNSRKKVPPGGRVDGRESSTGSVGFSSQDESSSKEKESTEDDEKKKEVSFEEGTSVPSEKSEANLGTGVTAMSSKTVIEVAEVIKEQFRIAASSGVEVSSVLDMGLPNHRPSNVINRVICSRISDALSMLMYSCSSFKQLEGSTVNSLRFAKAWYEDSGNRMSGRCGNLSSTLDMLSVWEMKLYEAVKNEENLRILYKQKCKRLRSLDERGAESQKIEAVQSSITKLLSKLDISMKSIDAISRRIHRLRDEELQPLIAELIKRSIAMWKRLLDCHQTQFMAVIQCKSQILTARTVFQKGEAMKVTRELEVELFNWLCCFRDWIKVQKQYFVIMNEWLRRCIFVDVEETPDGAPPFSPGRSGAPPIFVIFNDLAEAMRELLSEQHVAETMEACTAKVRSLWLTQDEVQRRRQRADQKFKDLANRLRSKRDGSSAFSVELLNRFLDEDKIKHREEVMQVRDVAQSSLRDGLIPVFHELGNFAVEMLRAYEKVRLPPVERSSWAGWH